MEPHLRFPHKDICMSRRMFFVQKRVTYFGNLCEKYSQETSERDFLKVFWSTGKEKWRSDSVGIDFLKTKRNLRYKRNQSVPRSKHFPPRL
jgi:hypothetical protein